MVFKIFYIKDGRLRFLVVYLVIFYSLALLLGWWLKKHYQNSFSMVKLEKMIGEKSAWSDKTDDACKFAIFGDPVAAGSEFVKIELYCREKTSKSTLALKAIADWSYGGGIKKLARINDFESDLILKSGWVCWADKNLIKDYEQKVQKKITVRCFAPDSKIKIGDVLGVKR